MVPVGGVATVGGVLEHDLAVLGRPSHVVEVEVGEHHVGDFLGADPQFGQLDEELPTLHRPAFEVAQPGVDEHHPVTGAQKEPAQGDLEHAVLGDEAPVGCPIGLIGALGSRGRAHAPVGDGRLHPGDAVDDRRYRDLPHPHRPNLTDGPMGAPAGGQPSGPGGTPVR